jgi:putative transposase
MIDRSHKLPLIRQVKALGVSRSSIYYQSRSISDAGLSLMRRIDEIHLDHPFAGSRMMRDLLCHEDIHFGRRHVSTLMRRIGIEALYRKPNTSRRHPLLGGTLFIVCIRTCYAGSR